MPPRLQLRSLARPAFTEHYLTAVAADGAGPEVAEGLFDALAVAAREHAIEPIQQKAYGPSGARADILAARGRAFARRGVDPAAPCTFTAGRPDEEEPLGAQLWGVTLADGGGAEIHTVGDGPCGRLLELPQLRLLWLSAVDGAPGAADDFGAQARTMFERADEALARHGFGYRDVARTWIYLRRLLDDYDRFNEVRTAFHRERQVAQRSRLGAFPASTGIGGVSDGARCLMDVLAVAFEGEAQLRPLTQSSRQSEAFDYGSGFSRGAVFELAGAKTVLVSGTASIGADGRSRHRGDAEAQALETLLAIAALLEPEGGGLSDVALGTLFAKDRSALEAFERVRRLLELPELPLVPVLADVCRPELLIEIEAVALVAAATDGTTRRGGMGEDA